MENKKNILVTGVSGTGKSTVYVELKKRGVEAIGIDENTELSYWVNKKTKEVVAWEKDFTDEFISNHDWVCNVPVLSDLVEKAKKTVVVCGSSDNIVECMGLFEMTLLLKCSPETFTSRIKSRVDNDYGQDESTKKALLGYYKKYNQDCLDAGAVIIDAEQSIDEVVNKVLSYIE